MESINFPITLHKIFFTRSVVVAIPEYQYSPEAIINGPENKIDIEEIPDTPGLHMATMRSSLNPNGDKTAPYSIDMECAGIFAVEESLPPESAKQLVLITAHGVLYGSIREAILTITARQAHGPFTLGLSIMQQKALEITN
ncbi:MAG: hypothetical protein ACYC2R_02490 [Burkholderiales bacterium]